MSEYFGLAVDITATGNKMNQLGKLLPHRIKFYVNFTSIYFSPS